MARLERRISAADGKLEMLERTGRVTCISRPRDDEMQVKDFSAGKPTGSVV